MSIALDEVIHQTEADFGTVKRSLMAKAKELESDLQRFWLGIRREGEGTAMGGAVRERGGEIDMLSVRYTLLHEQLTRLYWLRDTLAEQYEGTKVLIVSLIWKEVGEGTQLQHFFQFIRACEGEVLESQMDGNKAAMVRVRVPWHLQWQIGSYHGPSHILSIKET